MDFFDRQDRAYRNTKLLVFYFIAGVMLLILSIYVAASLIFAGVTTSRHSPQDEYEIRPVAALWNPMLLLGVGAGTLAVIGIGSGFKTMELSGGGKAVAEMLGGRLVSSNTTDPDERKLLNVVEEMALASGLPVPQVFVLDQESGINAFAAGHTHSDAAVTVTRGCMKSLSRDELQGVIGHEFSHILNGDMRLNIRLIGILFGILCLAIIGRILLQVRGGRSSKDKSNVLPLLGLVLILVGWVGVFFGKLIQAAVSRQREFLADASAVQFTRNPQGIAGALKKIGGSIYGSKLQTAHAGEASHMFFGNGLAEPLFNFLATHPPLEERIRAIDPSWDGKFVALKRAGALAEEAEPEPELAGRASSRPPMPPFPFPFPAAGWGGSGRGSGLDRIVPPIIAAHAVLPHLGAPTTVHLQHAVAFHESLPNALRTAAHDPLGAAALVYALLLSSQPEVRARELLLLGDTTSQAARQETERLLPEVAGKPAAMKLPLIDLALPALRGLSPDQYLQFKGAIQRLIECDGEINLFEYVLQKAVLRHLDPQFHGARKTVIQYYALGPLLTDCAVLLSALARAGTSEPTRVQAAFEQGAQLLRAQARGELALVPEADCDLAQLDEALNRLSNAAPQIKKNVLTACAQTVTADGFIHETEAELLRAIADTLDCPMPPFVQAQAEAPAASMQ